MAIPINPINTLIDGMLSFEYPTKNGIIAAAMISTALSLLNQV